jgi:hypothetical protein
MALAPFFDKAALAAAAVLQGFDRERFAAKLATECVAIAFDDAAVSSSEGRTTLTLAVNLLARLYPGLIVTARGPAAEDYRPTIEALARAINPVIDLGEDVPRSPGARTVTLVVGVTAAAHFGFDADATAIYIGSHGWDAHVSTSGPVGNGPSALPFGAAAAACRGAANVFRHVFRAQLPSSGLDHALTLSTLSLTTRLNSDAGGTESSSNTLIADIGTVDIGGVVQVGTGAVGQGFLWTLVRVPKLEGTLDLVDAEAVDDTNPQRYVLTTVDDVGAGKVTLAASLLPRTADQRTLPFQGGHAEMTSGPEASDGARIVRDVPPAQRASLSLVPHPVRWGKYLASRPQPWRLARVVVTLDSARDRIAVQAALPRWIANAWTQPGDLGLSRHAGFGATACLACLYLPTGAVMNEDARIAREVGLQDLMLVRRLLATNAPVDDAILTQIATGLGVHVDRLLAFRGRPLRAFHSEAVCGGVVMRLQAEQRHSDIAQAAGALSVDAARQSAGGQPQDRAVMVPMAFQSVMAGVLLAAALVADAAGHPAPTAGQKAVLNLLRPVTARLLVPVARHASGKCLCQDADYLDAYNGQWGTEACRAAPSHECVPND